jgi:site-specific recombinase XerD
MINTLKSGKTGGPARGQTSAGNTGRGLAEISDRKHLTSREVERLMLRHACGFALAEQGADTRLIQDYLGHRNIQHTVKYTATNPTRFEKIVALTK